MAERRGEAFRVAFHRSVKIEFHVANITSGAGLVAFRDFEEPLERKIRL